MMPTKFSASSLEAISVLEVFGDDRYESKCRLVTAEVMAEQRTDLSCQSYSDMLVERNVVVELEETECGECWTAAKGAKVC